jgi:hypothetical protein
VAVEALESFFSLYGTPHFCVTQSTYLKRHFELLVASLRLEMQKPIAIKSHKTNSSCESQLQRELLAYESMEGITFVTYQFTHIFTLTLHGYTQISFQQKFTLKLFNQNFNFHPK